MLLSIIVPVYNMAGGNKLQFCLDSLMGQTIDDYEVIAVDDKSTDSSLQVLREYESRYPGKLKVIASPENRRQGGARNLGLKAASGIWVGFVDSDDWVSQDCYEKLLKKADRTGADVVGCDYSLVTEQTFAPGRIVQNNTAEQTGVLDQEKHRLLLMRSGSMVIKIYKRQVLTEHQLEFPEGIFYEDNCAGPLWSLYFKQFERVEEPLYFYYQHQVSTVHHITEAKCRDRMKAAVLLYEACKERGFLELYRPEIEYRFTELYYVNTLFSYLSGVKHPRLAFVKELYDGLKGYFPDFEQNAYYQSYTGAEEKQLIAMQRQSVERFFLYYRLKQVVRALKKRLRS